MGVSQLIGIGSLRRTLTRGLGLCAFGAFALVLPAIIPTSFGLSVAIQFLFFAFLAMGWNAIGGYGGQIELGMAVYVGIGAYVTALGVSRWDVSPWLALPVGVVIAILWSFVIGYPLFKLSGHYFAIATIAICLALQQLFLDWNFVNGAGGIIFPIKRTPNLLYLQFTSQVPYYYLILFLCAGALIFLNWLRKSRIGYQLQALKESEDLAASLGAGVRWAKIRAYTVAALFAATGGWFYAVQRQFVDPNSVMSLDLSVKIAMMAMVGGAGALWGPMVGALILVPLDSYLGATLGGSRAWRGMDFMIYGIIIMAISVVEPRGLLGLLERARRRYVSPRS